ncbi:hypothetical protein CANMA_004379 [Candida margitis]|uniref:uncharacterized protein n=1 Tax=Candida margitis TaxID=1775924 RepID=UPI00222665C6|nr:uncharacterized protein CANMA_004379 [Candida margitis]KAI5957868.1 hypothetical protein CANMA_004379 [Candida margitis]
MDNRERYQKYKDRSSIQLDSRQNPSTLSSKLKNIFTSWNKSDADKDVSLDSNASNVTKTSSQPEPKFLGSSTFKLPGSFHIHHDISTAHAQSSQQPPAINSSSSSSIVIDKDETTENPNDILSAFFKEKGNRKLTDVEYEGVVALMSKSRAGTPYKREFAELSFSNAEPSLKRRHLGNDTTLVGNETSILGSTPTKQKSLKINGNTTLHTPGYTPKYNSVYNDTFERSYSVINNTTGGNFSLSTRRANLRSRRPAPYKSRIKSSIPSRTVSDNKTLTNADISNANLTNTTTEKIRNSKSPSKTAQTLLGILDGKGENDETSRDSQQQQHDKLKLFINPYGSGSEKKNRKGVKTPSTASNVTASTISKTISYSKAGPLSKGGVPERESDAQHDSSSAGNDQKLDGTQKPPEQQTKTNFNGMDKPKSSIQTTDTLAADLTSFTKPAADQSKAKSKVPLFSKGFEQPLASNFNTDNQGASGAMNGVDLSKNDGATNFTQIKVPFTKSEPSRFNSGPNGEEIRSSNWSSTNFHPIYGKEDGKTPEGKVPKTNQVAGASFPSIRSNHLDTKNEVNNANQLNGASHEASVPKFSFPSPQLVMYDFDDAEVNKYKSLFSF